MLAECRNAQQLLLCARSCSRDDWTACVLHADHKCQALKEVHNNMYQNGKHAEATKGLRNNLYQIGSCCSCLSTASCSLSQRAVQQLEVEGTSPATEWPWVVGPSYKFETYHLLALK